MIVQSNFLSKLKDFGLNSYESKLWTALLSRGVSTAGELSDIANVPRSRTYDVLESLEKKGFIIMKLGKPIKYLAVSPSEVIERVKKKFNKEAKDRVDMLDEIKNSEVLDELTLLHKQGLEIIEPTDCSGFLKGRNNIYTHMESMIKRAKKSVVISTTEDGLTRKATSLLRAIKTAKKKGVSVNIMAPITDANKEDKKTITSFAKVSHREPGARYCVTDDTEILFFLMNEKEMHTSFEVGVWVNAPDFATDLTKFTKNT